MTDFLDWQSSLSAEQIFADSESFSHPCALETFGDEFIYLTQLKSEKNRSVINRSSPQGVVCLTPSPFDLRSKISEYGGKPFWLHGNTLYFVNQSDQCLFRQEITASGASAPTRVTSSSGVSEGYLYSDIVELSDSMLLAVVEVVQPQGSVAESEHCIALINLNNVGSAPKPIVRGADFYSNLVYEPTAGRIAWVEWDHPNMPWDESRLMTSKVLKVNHADLSLEPKEQITLAAGGSVCQLRFAGNSRLFYVQDQPGAASTTKDFWNVYCHDFETGNNHAVSHEKLEFGYPHWQYGDSRIEQFDHQHLLAIASSPSGDHLLLIDQQSLAYRFIGEANGSLQNLNANGQGSATCVRFNAAKGPQLMRFDGLNLTETVLRDSGVRFRDVSLAQTIEYATADGSTAHGFYYAPKNSQYSQPANTQKSHSLPPLIVLVHGGPTARAYGHFDVQKQFWTSRGFALLDVNHRGSSGYGRTYRDALYGAWGEMDAADIIDGVQALIEQSKVDPKRVCIRGKSAGGYAVLRVLTEYPNMFMAGACYYGIGNLATLAEVTHKFEKHYTDRLIDEVYDSERVNQSSSRFYQRSPIYKLSKLKSAMIVFQGLQDKVVPPSVAKEIIDALKMAEVPYEYVEYADEAHGFRQVDNNVDALNQELAFYRRVLG